MELNIINLDLTLGPFHYRLLAHDTRGEELLGRLADNVDCRHFNGLPDRHIHLIRHLIEPVAVDSFLAGRLPPELAALVPEELPPLGWQIAGNDTTHLTWRHAETSHAFWTMSCYEADQELPFYLPLDLLFHDIVQSGGGIIHGGLAVYQDQGVLLTAPPGGGKTTTFSTLPDNWALKSDDASLVWPDANGAFLVCPLPTWSVLLGTNPRLEQIMLWQIGKNWPLQRVLFLEKSNLIKLAPQRSIDAVFPLYRALSEYPTVILGRTPYRGAIFKVAAAIARNVQTWTLQLPRKGNFWPILEEELIHGLR